jgi:Domain of unknown function DUF11
MSVGNGVRRVVRGKGAVVLAAIAAGAVFALPAAAGQIAGPPTADLGVVSIKANKASAAHGTRVTFTEVIRNNGPETAELDTVPQITGGVLVAEVCDLGISADTPFCEYGDVAPGTSLTTKFIVRVTATHGSVVVKGGVTSEAPLQDDNPFNQYRTASVRVTG